MKLFKILKVVLVSVSVVVFLFGVSICNTPSFYAANHEESALHGFAVEDGGYNITWGSRRTLNIFRMGKVLGTVTTYVGIAKSITPLSSGKTLKTVMIRSIINPKPITYTVPVLWWTETRVEYGRTEELKYTIDFANNAELMDVSPKNVPTSNTYTIGVNLGVNASSSGNGSVGASLGVSASQTFVANALKVYNLSDTSNNYASSQYVYQNSEWRWDWERNSYGNYESEQKAAYSVGTNSNYYYLLQIYAAFSADDQTPNYWQNRIPNSREDNVYFASLYI